MAGKVYTDEGARALIQQYVPARAQRGDHLTHASCRYIDAQEAELRELQKDEKKNLWKITALEGSFHKNQEQFQEGGFSRFSGSHSLSPANKGTGIPDVCAKKVLRALHEEWDGHNVEFLERIRSRTFKKVSDGSDPQEVLAMPGSEAH